MWVLIDNYDSFTHILRDYLLQVHDNVIVVRNDKATVAEILSWGPERIIISPGPATPEDSGITLPLIKAAHKYTPILGICLGHQALAQCFGAKLMKAQLPMHGKTSMITHHGNHSVFKNIPHRFSVMRYHSLLIDGCTDVMEPLAYTDEKELMAFAHKVYPAIGIQFHPESVMTEYGLQIIRNWNAMFPL